MLTSIPFGLHFEVNIYYYKPLMRADGVSGQIAFISFTSLFNTQVISAENFLLQKLEYHLIMAYSHPLYHKAKSLARPEVAPCMLITKKAWPNPISL